MQYVKEDLLAMPVKTTGVIYGQVVTRWSEAVWEINNVTGKHLYDLSQCWAQILIRIVLGD